MVRASTAACELVAATSTSSRPSNTAHIAARSGGSRRARERRRAGRRRSAAEMCARPAALDRHRAPARHADAGRSRCRCGPAASGGCAPVPRGAGRAATAGRRRAARVRAAAPVSGARPAASAAAARCATPRSARRPGTRHACAGIAVLFRLLTGLADGLAPKERRYAQARFAPTTWVPRFLSAAPADAKRTVREFSCTRSGMLAARRRTG